MYPQEIILTSFSITIIVLIIAEMIFSQIYQWQLYTLKGLISNFYLMCLNLGLDFLMRFVTLGALSFMYAFHLFTIETSILYWVVLILLEDLMYYLLHVVDHYSRLFWAVHVTHHSSKEFNLSIGFRSSVFQPLYRFIYFAPIALLGFRPLDILFIYSATQIWGILVHTKTIDKMHPILEYIFVTPSHHRVHHGSNVEYLDRNMGMMLIIWDRLFGTFQKEISEIPPIYGLTKDLVKTDPWNLVAHEWKHMWKDVTQKGISIKDRLSYIFLPAGWHHEGKTETASQMRRNILKK
ncbi:MAG: sterol desaturase family protein [Saprospiraceae bacterium]